MLADKLAAEASMAFFELCKFKLTQAQASWLLNCLTDVRPLGVRSMRGTRNQPCSNIVLGFNPLQAWNLAFAIDRRMGLSRCGSCFSGGQTVELCSAQGQAGILSYNSRSGRLTSDQWGDQSMHECLGMDTLLKSSYEANAVQHWLNRA